jgi:DNA polymerase-3 subunit epsilon
VAGFFGHGVGALRRSSDHVDATAFVWQHLVRLLEAEGVSTWRELQEWLAEPVGPRRNARRTWPMPREARLSLPDAPGVYRFLRTSGDVLYVGKATSLHHRVNSYFRKQQGVPERMLEMLSQARAISFEVAPSALEAALREPDEIKNHRPPYNIALTENRTLWFASPDLEARHPRPSARCPLGPFSSAELLDQLGALARADRAALMGGQWGPDAAVFEAGYARLRASQPELAHGESPARAALLRLGTRLWREGRRERIAEDEDNLAPVLEWTPELVQTHLEWIALRAALARRRAIWLTRLVDATVVWCEPGATSGRLLVVENGVIAGSEPVDPTATPPVPAGYGRPVAARREAITLACFDRVRVLTTELKRLVAVGAPVSLRTSAAPPLTGARLAAALWWV